MYEYQYREFGKHQSTSILIQLLLNEFIVDYGVI